MIGLIGMFLMILGIFLMILVIVTQCVYHLVYGSYINKQKQNRYMNLNNDEYRINSFDNSILSIPGTFISNVPFGIFAKYYIYEIGMVLRWSKLHKKINEYYKIGLKKEKI